MKRRKVCFFVVLLSICLSSCTGKKAIEQQWAKDAIASTSKQLAFAAERYDNIDSFPRTINDGKVVLVPDADWTSGFFPGSLWIMYDLTGDEYFKAKAQKQTAKMIQMQHNNGTHDLGFMMFCSYGNQYIQQKDSVTAVVLVESARSLASRFDPKIGLIRSWDFGSWNYPVIVDNMMNLELLFWASNYTGDSSFRNIAIQHADKTIANHFRDDYSSFHVVSYKDDGTVESRGTHQGFSDNSAWSRGQAWGLYGYTVCYRETGLDRYLNQARKIASYIMTTPRTPEDKVPYWDYDAPGIPNEPRDASAAAVIASAMLELSTLTGQDMSKEYKGYGVDILKSLSSDKYLAQQGTNGGFLLLHSVGQLPQGREIDAPLNYADYYYLEALKRYLVIDGVDISNAE